MTHIRASIRKGFKGLAFTCLIAALPLTTLASVGADNATSPHSDTGCAIPSNSSYGPGVHTPTGASAVAFVYQCPDSNNPTKPYVGDWLSAHFVYYPQTSTQEPLSPVVYLYNSSTGLYDYSQWVWSAAAGSYNQVDGSTATPPPSGQYVSIVGAPAPSVSSSNPAGGQATPDTNTAGGTNTIGSSTTNSATDDTSTSIGVTNDLTGTASSGDALGLADTSTGDATSGDALSEADIINMLQSSSNALGTGNNVVTFTYNVDGNVNGDLLFDPAQIDDVQGGATINNNAATNLTVNTSTDASITNNVNLSANSGNATLADNTKAGNATSGAADTVVNIVNSIESAVTAGKSFIGTININGNLNGDILLPADFVNELLADNVPTVSVTAPSSTNTVSNSGTNTTTITNTNNLGINNSVTSTAKSGNATSTGNTQAGNTTSGAASTHVTAFNLTGSQVIASNDILVFVNVTGKWTGMIVNAPGATAAELGGGIKENNTVSNTATIHNTTNEQINNNVTENATSGNATTRDNTSVGDATTGNANNAANLLNIEGSTLDLSNWFGILFINVFGTWNGDFGVNSSAGNSTAGKGGYLVGTTSFVRYAPVTTTGATSGSSGGSSSSVTASKKNKLPHGTVLAASSSKPAAPQLSGGRGSLLFPIMGITLSGAALYYSERSGRRQHR